MSNTTISLSWKKLYVQVTRNLRKINHFQVINPTTSVRAHNVLLTARRVLLARHYTTRAVSSTLHNAVLWL
jgi:hypothetical protein